MNLRENEGFVLDHHLVFIETRFPNGELYEVTLEGIIECSDDVFIKVDKRLITRKTAGGQVHVRAIDYKYHAWLVDPDGSQRNLIRYCTAHGLDGEEKHGLHVHLFDSSGNQIGEPPLALEDLPTLGDFIPQAVDLGRKARSGQEHLP